MQIAVQTVTTLVTGLTQVKDEVHRHRKSQDTSSNDRFVQVMEVNNLLITSLCALY